MALKLFNTLGRKLEAFEPLHAGEVSLYTCGPTVYDYPHLGNYRAYLFADLLKRVLVYNNYKVKHVMNITDVDDKTIRNAQQENKSLIDFTEFYTKEFFRDRDALQIIPANIYTKASDYIDQMVSLIEILLVKKYAYKSDDGSVYFSIAKDKTYGKLAQLNLAKLAVNASGRMKNDEYDKENAKDFALWKAWDQSDGEIFWETSLGKGRPGWHIECSAMSMKELGESLDIHTGGVDNIFPHHENEIAQSESATGQPLAKYWIHNEWLLVDGKKMAKSTGNFYTLSSIIEKGYSPLVYRYLTLTAHYRKQLNFTWESLTAAQTALTKLENFVRDITEMGEINKNYQTKFKASLEDDLNAPQALAVMWEMINDTSLPHPDKLATILNFDQVLGLGLNKLESIKIPEEVKKIAQAREVAREAKNFAQADILRQQAVELGYLIDDTPDGPKIRAK
ncbi:MAG: cysteine--tRNA ligase [bacterium]|nr:cysteine--tRNA ligase [bacterium]